MQSITITRPVVIKVRVTENYKKVVVGELQRAVQQLDMEIQQLDFQIKRITPEIIKKTPQGMDTAKKQIENGIYDRVQKKQKLLDKIKEIARLTPGSEVIHGRVESLVEINVGDNWNQVMNVELLVEDGVVLEIRQFISDNVIDGVDN